VVVTDGGSLVALEGEHLEKDLASLRRTCRCSQRCCGRLRREQAGTPPGRRGRDVQLEQRLRLGAVPGAGLLLSDDLWNRSHLPGKQLRRNRRLRLSVGKLWHAGVCEQPNDGKRLRPRSLRGWDAGRLSRQPDLRQRDRLPHLVWSSERLRLGILLLEWFLPSAAPRRSRLHEQGLLRLGHLRHRRLRPLLHCGLRLHR
jgi:hypothetical protein